MKPFTDPHYIPPKLVRVGIGLLVLGLMGLSVFLFVRYQHDERVLTELPVRNREEPVARENRTVQLPAGQQYATIDIPFPSIAMNKSGHVLGYKKRDDGRLDMLLWIAGDTIDLSEITGETFVQVLDINDQNQILAVIKRNGQVYLKGYAYTLLPENRLSLVPLARIDLRSFGLENLQIETDLTLDSQIGQEVDGRKVRVRSIIDMTKQGMILAQPEE